jgi:hypothetical protein
MGQALSQHAVVERPATNPGIEGMQTGEVVALAGLLIVLGREGRCRGPHGRSEEGSGKAGAQKRSDMHGGSCFPEESRKRINFSGRHIRVSGLFLIASAYDDQE